MSSTTGGSSFSPEKLPYRQSLSNSPLGLPSFERQWSSHSTQREEPNGDQSLRQRKQDESSDHQSSVKFSQSSNLPQDQSSHNLQNNQQSVPEKKSCTTEEIMRFIAVLGIISLIAVIVSNRSSSSPKDEDWRTKVDRDGHLPDNQRSMVRASLKPILDKSSTSQDNSISTLLILSSNEEVAAKLGQCLLRIVNSQSNKDQVNQLNKKFSSRIASFSIDISGNRSSEASGW